MAIGLGRLFGIELPQNFNSPYQARNPSDFWGRWHITLSLWLRDYLFYPIYFEMDRETNHRLKLVVSLFVTMLLGGLWHGAHWTFALWGLYNCFLLLLYYQFKDHWDRWNLSIQRGVTFTLITLSWIFFRSSSFLMIKQWGSALWKINPPGYLSITPLLWPIFLASSVAVIGVNLFPNASSYQGFKTLRTCYQIGLGVLCVFAILCMNFPSKFLYYQF